MAEFTHIHQTPERRAAALEALELALKHTDASKVIIFTDNNRAQVKVSRVGMHFPANIKKELRINFKKLRSYELAKIAHQIEKGVFSPIKIVH